MEQVNLPLFNQTDIRPQLANREATANPLLKPAEEVKPYPTFYNPERNLENVLNAVLPDNKEENKLQKARRILGETAKDQTDDQLQTFISELQFLIDSWLDGFEMQVFQGVTLKQLLRER